MYTLLLPINKKSNIRGLWIYKNKVYRDNLKIAKYKRGLSIKVLKKLAYNYNQLALFYYNNKRGFIYNNNSGLTDKLNNRALFYHKGFKNLKDKIKGLLLKYKGLTIYKKGAFYTLVCYY